MAFRGGSLKYGGSPSTISITITPRDQISTCVQRGVRGIRVGWGGGVWGRRGPPEPVFKGCWESTQIRSSTTETCVSESICDSSFPFGTSSLLHHKGRNQPAYYCNFIPFLLGSPLKSEPKEGRVPFATLLKCAPGLGIWVHLLGKGRSRKMLLPS